MISVTDSIFVDGPLDSVYDYCWDSRQWPSITPHVKEVRILEEGLEEGCNEGNAYQRMAMTVESDGRLFHTESIRRTAPLHWIEYDQLKPPSFLLSHSGRWRFIPEQGGTRVVLVHRFSADHPLARNLLGLSASEDVDAYIGQRLKRNGLTTLVSVKKLVEGEAQRIGAVAAQQEAL